MNLRRHWNEVKLFGDRFWQRWVREFTPVLTSVVLNVSPYIVLMLYISTRYKPREIDIKNMDLIYAFKNHL